MGRSLPQSLKYHEASWEALVEARVIKSLLTPPARPLMSRKSCSTSTCIAGSVKKPTAEELHCPPLVMAQKTRFKVGDWVQANMGDMGFVKGRVVKLKPPVKPPPGKSGPMIVAAYEAGTEAAEPHHALHVACAAGLPTVVAEILGTGAAVDETGASGNGTPLHSLCMASKRPRGMVEKRVFT